MTICKPGPSDFKKASPLHEAVPNDARRPERAGLTVVAAPQDDEYLSALGLIDTGDVTRRTSLWGVERLIVLYGDNPSAPSAIAGEFGLQDGKGGLMRPIGTPNAAGVGDG